MLDCVSRPGRQSDADIAQEAAVDSASGMILSADQDALGQLEPGDDIVP